MRISWKIWCLKESTQELMDKVSRIMDYPEATSDQEFHVEDYWKEPRMNQIFIAYNASRLPEGLNLRFAALDPEAKVFITEQGEFLEYVLSTTIPDMFSSPKRVFAACNIHKVL